jgi:hypothetical protein
MNISKMKARILELLEQVRNGAIQPEAALEQLKFLPFEDIGIARVDTHRELRQGFPELIYGKDKDFESIQRIVEAMYGLPSPVLVTRLSPFKASRLLKAFPDAQYFPKARILRLNERYIRPQNLGPVGLVSAGTSDGPVLEEACITLETLGVKTEVLFDVGVAGVHRLFPEIERLQTCRVLIAIAGMEGALASLLGGMFEAPVLAVPTSCGYGSHLNGFTPLLAMLTSCANLAVFNIDNGVGAALFAFRVLKAQVAKS